MITTPDIQIIDTHTHLCDPVFDTDRTEVIDRARKIGVTVIISVSENLKDAHRNLELAAKHCEIRPTAGLYPTALDLNQAETMISFIREHRQKLIAIGEVGLDFWVVKAAAEQAIQKEIFGQFIDLSKELNLPLNVHSRSAGHYAIALLLERSAHRVQMHAFDGKASTAMQAVEAGYFFSIPPSVVRSPQKQKLVKRLPLSCLLVETDSPVLGPNHNMRNEPANIIQSIQAIAEIKEISQAEVMEAVYQNTLRLYGDSEF